ncbi:MAG: GAF domain-containing protein [Bacteriovoracia bacterium]
MDYDGTYLDYQGGPEGNRLLLKTPGEFLGKRVSEVLLPDLAGQVMRALESLRHGAQAVEFEYTLPQDGQTQAYAAKLMALSEREVLCVCRDITRRKKTEAEHVFMTQVSKLVGAQGDLGELLHRIAREFAPRFGDHCVITLVNADRRVARVEAYSPYEKTQALLSIAAAKYLWNGTNVTVDAVFAQDGPVLVSEMGVTETRDLAVDDEGLKLLAKIALRSLISFPLRSRDRVIGVINLGMIESNRRFFAEDVEVMERLALFVSLVVTDWQNRHAAELASLRRDELAYQIQELHEPVATIDKQLGVLLKSWPLQGRESAPLKKALKSIQGASEQLMASLQEMNAENFSAELHAEPKRVEDVIQQARSAIPGRVTTEVTMPNTLVLCDEPRLAQAISQLARATALRVGKSASIHLSAEVSEGSPRFTVTSDEWGTSKRSLESTQAAEQAQKIIEAHGGRLWSESNPPPPAVGGADVSERRQKPVYRFTLPEFRPS